MRFPLPLLLLAPAALLAQASDVTQLERVTVLAGQFPTGDQPGAVLSALDVVRTPGTAADINRALQTMPGIQLADEGNALFVRGGDSAETATLINGVRYPNATRLNAPAGNFTGTINPFDARRITFSSGGFSARYGDMLSGVVDVETMGAPAVHGLTVGAGLGAVTLGADAALGAQAGIRVMGTRTNVAPIQRLNGASRDYPEPPNGHDVAASAAWEYRPGAELRAFAVEQTLHLALNVNLPGQRGRFAQALTNRLGTVNWTDVFGRWTTHVDAGAGTLRRTEAVATGAFVTDTRHQQVAARTSYEWNERTQLSFGADKADDTTAIEKSFAGGSFSGTVTGTRRGAFVEADTSPVRHVRLVGGVRADHSSLTDRTTADPRLTVAWEPRRAVTTSLAAGVYHQVPAAFDFVGASGRVALPPMRVNELLGAVQVGREDRIARVEVYRKSYADLVALNRSYLPVAGGDGTADGLDVFLKSPLPWAMTGRVTYSYADSRRRDPDTGALAPAPFDVRHTGAVLLERAFGGWVTGLGWRYASGRPVTPIIGGRATASGFAPAYGAPFSVRLPALVRVDLNASRYYRLNRHTGLVLYAALTNALNRANVYAYEYSEDYATRRPTPSLFKRGLYFGFTLQFN